MKPLRKVIVLIRAAREAERDLIRGIMQYSRVHGDWSLHQEPPHFFKSRPLRSRISQMQRWKADGVIGGQDRMEELRTLGLPSVIVEYNCLPRNTCRVVADDRAIGRMGAGHLLGVGFEHFAFCGLRGMHWSEGRCAGFSEAVVRAGHRPFIQAAPIAVFGTEWQSAQRPVGRWLARLPKPLGLMTCNDDLAILLAEICRNQGIRVPDEIAIIGVDNDELVCNGCSPPLSSVALSLERAGYEAAELLDRVMRGEKPAERRVVIRPTHVVARQSTDIVAIKDQNLAKAVSFIRGNAGRLIQVQDVAAAAGLCKRTLQHRFRALVGQTVLQAIALARIQHVNRLLVETDLPVSEIARAMGFEDDNNFARFFRRHANVSPMAYRRRHRRV